MRQPEHDDVVAGEGLLGGGLEDALREGPEVGLQHAEGLPRVRAAREGADLDVGVAEQQPQHLPSGVPAGAGDGDGDWHVHDYTDQRMLPQHGVRPKGRCRPCLPVARFVAMSRLPFEQYLAHLEAESRRFRDVLADCDPAARVPGCPDWDAADLLWHLGGEVQDFWAWVVSHRPRAPP